MAFCEECGAAVGEGARFCERCGAPVAGAAPDGKGAERDARANGTADMPRPDAASKGRLGEQGCGSRPEPERQLRRTSRLPLVIGIVVAVVTIAVVALYVVPLFVWHPHDPHEGVANLPPEEEAKKDAVDPIADEAERQIVGSEDTKEKGADTATGRTYYVFESSSSGGYVTTDPTALVNDYPGSISPEYYLSLVLFDDLRGKICWMGCLADLTYEVDGDVITLHVPNEPSVDGERLEVGDGTLTMRDEWYTTVLRQVDEMPQTFEWVLR